MATEEPDEPQPRTLDAEDPGGAAPRPSSGPARPPTPRSPPTTCWPPCSTRPTASPAPSSPGSGVEPAVVRARIGDELARLPQAFGGAEPTIDRALREALEAADRQRIDMGDEYLSVEHLLLALADRLGVERDELLQALRDVRGSHRVTSPEPRGDVPGAGEVRPGPDRAWPARGRWTRSSAATRRSAGSSRCCRGAPRTTRSSSASPAWARRPSSRAWPSGSSRATSPRA